MSNRLHINILRAKLLSKYSLDTFVQNLPSIAAGGTGIVVSGCPSCKKMIALIGRGFLVGCSFLCWYIRLVQIRVRFDKEEKAEHLLA